MIIVKVNERNFSLVRKALWLVANGIKRETGYDPSGGLALQLNSDYPGYFGDRVASRNWLACAGSFDKQKRPLEALMLVMLALKHEYHHTATSRPMWWCYELASGVIEYVILNRISWAKTDLKELEKRVARIKKLKP